MGRDRNVLRRYKSKICSLGFNVIIDEMVSRGFIKEDFYKEIFKGLNDEKVSEHLYNKLMINETLLDKFVDVLKEHYEVLYANIQKDRNIVNNSLAFGGVPLLPPHHIERIQYVTQLHDKLVNLTDNDFLIVYGLAGMGKSSLVNEVIQDPEFQKVFWLNLGDLDKMDLFISKLKRLHNMATKSAEIDSPPPDVDDLDHWGYNLRTLFTLDKLRSSVLVLDDIKCPEILQFFVKYPLGKYVATTQDKGVFRDSHIITHNNQMEVGGLSPDETMRLLASALGISKLPEHFKEVHDLCHGSPISTRHFCTFLMDHKDMALNNHRFFKDMTTANPKEKFLHNAIEKNVDKLSLTEQDFFHSLAIIPKHVNIDLKTLQLMWPEMDVVEILDSMTKLMDKSLVTGFYDMSLNRQIYGIHELVDNYLSIKARSRVETMRQFHKILIDSFDDLPQDCDTYKYLLTYYGHHLKGAGLMEGFSKFFDLDFIKHKLMYLGPCDLISDFKAYENEIVRCCPEAESWLEALKTFVPKYHWQIRDHPDTDMVQFMLFDHNPMYEQMKNRAIADSKKLYFDIENDHEQVKVTGTIIEKDVTAVALTSPNATYIGKSNGDIFHKSFRKEFAEKYSKHCRPIDSIQHNPKTNTFISLSRVENLALFWTPANFERPPKSPNYHKSHLSLDGAPDVMHLKDPITCLHIPTHCDKDMVLLGSQRGSVGTFTKTGATLNASTAVGYQITEIIKVGSEILATMRDGSSPPAVFRFIMNSGMYCRGDEIDLGPAKRSKLFFVPRASRDEVAIICGTCFWIVGTILPPKQYDLTDVNDDKITCGAFTEDDENLVLGSEGVLYVHQMTEGQSRKIHLHSSFRVMSVWTEGRDLVYFVSYDDDKLRCHEVRLPPQQDKRLVGNADLYTCYWRDSTPIYTLVSDNNHIEMFIGREVIRNQINENRIGCLCFSQEKKVLVGCENGAIWKFSPQSKTDPVEMARFSDFDLGVLKIKSFAIGSSCDVISNGSSGSHSGIFVACTRHQVLSKLNDCEAVITNFDEMPVDFAVIYDTIAVVDCKCQVTLLSLEGEILKQFSSVEENCQVVSSCFHHDMLAMISKRMDGSYWLEVLRLDKGKLNDVIHRKLSSEPTTLAFSFDETLLAVGYSSGKIQVVNLESGEEVELNLHQKPISYLLFMPFGLPILVSLGEKAAWWDLREFHKKEQCQRNEKKSVRIWSSKEPKEQSVPYLLSSLNFQGNQLQYVTASVDFLTFLIIDSVRNVYKLQVIREE